MSAQAQLSDRLAVTTWPSHRVAVGKRSAITWAALRERLSTPAPRPVDPKTAKLACWSPATFVGNRRRKEFVEFVHAIVLDIDVGGPSLETVLAAVREFRCIVHSTRSATPGAPRWRIVLAISRPLNVAEHRGLWTALRDRLAAASISLDENTKDPSRLWFLPCEPHEGDFVFESVDGVPLDVDRMCAPEPLIAPRVGKVDRPAERTIRYPEVVLAGELASVRAAPEGERNATLNRSAFALAGFVASGAVERQVAYDALFAAARDAGLPEMEISSTLESAFKAGEKHPRLAPADRTRAAISRSVERRPARTIELMSAVEIANPLPELDCVVPALGIARGAPVLVAGYGFSGKTIAIQALALSMAAGRDLWGVLRCRQGNVVHLDFEQGQRVSSDRYQRLARGMNIDLASLGNALRLAVHPQVYLDDEDALAIYQRLFEGVALVIVDSLRASAPSLDENASDIRRTIDLLNRAAEKQGTVVLLIHHARKPRGDDGDASRYRIRGSSALFDACGSVFVFSAEKGAPTRVDHEKCRNTGKLVESFGLRVVDVPADGSSRNGLRVEHLEAEQLASSPARTGGQAQQADRAAEERIVKHLTENGPFYGGKRAFRDVLRMNREVCMAALGRLNSSGDIDIGRNAGRAYVRLPDQGAPRATTDPTRPVPAGVGRVGSDRELESDEEEGVKR